MTEQLSFLDANMRDKFWHELRSGEQLSCPCCDRYAQIYRRQLHATIGAQMIRCFKLGGLAYDYIHASELTVAGSIGVGDYTKAKYWNLIEPKEHQPEDKKASGYWKLTMKGVAFVKREVSITRYAIIFDDNVIRFEGEQITIDDVLNKKFSYQELMADSIEIKKYG